MSTNGSEHIYEVLGQSKPGECNGHIWKGEGRCPFCSDVRIGRQRTREITEMALAILEKNLSENPNYDKK